MSDRHARPACRVRPAWQPEVPPPSGTLCLMVKGLGHSLVTSLVPNHQSEQATLRMATAGSPPTPLAPGME
jgi:hypothetical protein